MSRNYQNQSYKNNQNYKPYKSYKKTYPIQNQNQIQETNVESSYNILIELKDYMFDAKNLMQFTKHTFNPFIETTRERQDKGVRQERQVRQDKEERQDIQEIQDRSEKPKPIIETKYRPQQSDSLFWCFFILKHGLSKYEMEIGNQHFVIEKQEKFRYIDLLRQNKELIKMHKIKPLSGLEDDLANKERISVKTFLALCVLENINILLVDKRKIYEIVMNDDPIINVVHRNSISYEHYIELDATEATVSNYRETYFKVSGFDANLKSMASYKVDELIDLCNKLGIKDAIEEPNKKKRSKKELYELIVMNF
jgi:hypothetical protein